MWSDLPFRQSYGYSVKNSFEWSMITGRKATEEASEVEVVRFKVGSDKGLERKWSPNISVASWNLGRKEREESRVF